MSEIIERLLKLIEFYQDKQQFYLLAVIFVIISFFLWIMDNKIGSFIVLTIACYSVFVTYKSWYLNRPFIDICFEFSFLFIVLVILGLIFGIISQVFPLIDRILLILFFYLAIPIMLSLTSFSALQEGTLFEMLYKYTEDIIEDGFNLIFNVLYIIFGAIYPPLGILYFGCFYLPLFFPKIAEKFKY